MSCERSCFKTVSDFRRPLLMNKLETNLKTWLDWAFLSIGAWNDVEIPSVSSFGGDTSRLRLVDDPSYTSGKVWESARKDWVWEVDIDYEGNNPISPAVIEVNSVVTAPSIISYPLGRVIFSTALSSSAVVQASYSYRYVQIYIADNAPWWNELQYNSFDSNDSHFSQDEKGNWSIGSHHRIQMPSVVIEAVPRATSRGAQLGDGAAWVEQDILCHVLAENRRDRNQIVDILRGQFDNNIWLFDDHLMAEDGAFPLDAYGDILDSTLIYPALVDADTGYRWQRCRFIRTDISEIQSPNNRLFLGTVRLTCEVFQDD